MTAIVASATISSVVFFLLGCCFAKFSRCIFCNGPCTILKCYLYTGFVLCGGILFLKKLNVCYLNGKEIVQICA